MLGLKMIGEQFRVAPLVEGALEPLDGRHLEPRREGHEPRYVPRRASDDRPRIHAAREIGTDRNVRDELALDAAQDQALRLRDRLFLVERLVAPRKVEIPIGG